MRPCDNLDGCLWEPYFVYATRNAAKHWSEKSRSKHRLLDALRRSAGGSNLLELGFDKDIERAAEVDSISVVPEYSSIRGAIR